MKKPILSFLIVGLCCVLSCKDELSSKITKIALRDVGNTLLLSSQDSTSLILPIIKIENNTYLLEFENPLRFEPQILVATVKESFKKAHLPSNYRVEVLRCSDAEVAYSYQIKNTETENIIPCAGRVLPLSCYYIQVNFIDNESKIMASYWLLFLVFLIALFMFLKLRKKKKTDPKTVPFSKIGQYQFYPQQNKLVKSAVEISLSKKECELLEIFYENLNTIVKRNELEKRVWEDNGVFVGRSLDTYISKLRKKLKHDDCIKLTNIHGVGYKLEVHKA